MRYILFSVCLSALLMSCSSGSSSGEVARAELNQADPMPADPALRHVVLFKFKEGASEADIRKVEEAFAALPDQIPEIQAFEWGTNNSPEGLDQGFTHCFLLTFASEADRATYLPHPDHKAFGELIGPYIEDVLVVDYWNGEGE